MAGDDHMTANYPVAANLATTLCCHAGGQWREVAGRDCYMEAKIPTLRGLCGLLLVSLATVCLGQEKEPHLRGVLQPPAGVFESVEKFEGYPLFILHFETNGTYRVQCSDPDPVQGIDGGGFFKYQGTESGVWRWEPQSHEIVLKATKTSHMARWFPHVFKIPQDRFERLEAVNPPPKGPQNRWPLWLPLTSPYFNRKVT